jgi:hypothetical protein
MKTQDAKKKSSRTPLFAKKTNGRRMTVKTGIKAGQEEAAKRTFS